ncbi:MAG: deferrochelatase/peroxidase EfeB, partial [Solirubrobacteraceae bacterium]|nr:deferrochelatase/peroxidase EfeB [Solirubrobacteraceae bacterium]
FLVARRIRMLIESWDRTSLTEQQRVFGRQKTSGAPLGGDAEHDTVNLAAKGSDGEPLIDTAAHIRLAAPATNNGTRILRRGYSFTDGQDPQLGQLDAGLFFLAYMNTPTSFVTLQRRLGVTDLLDEYIKHVGSGVFAIPPGIGPGEYVGQRLFS